MRDAFFYILLEPARQIKRRLESVDGEAMESVDAYLWKTVWEVASQATTDSLRYLARRTNNLVFPLLEETREQSKSVQQLHATETY